MDRREWLGSVVAGSLVGWASAASTPLETPPPQGPRVEPYASDRRGVVVTDDGLSEPRWEYPIVASSRTVTIWQ